MINELPRRVGPARILTRLGLVVLGFVIAAALGAVVVLAVWIFART